jgi:hypothetical protein
LPSKECCLFRRDMSSMKLSWRDCVADLFKQSLQRRVVESSSARCRQRRALMKQESAPPVEGLERAGRLADQYKIEPGLGALFSWSESGAR